MKRSLMTLERKAREKRGNNMYKVLIIDGQGGLLGKQMVEAVKKMIPEAKITAVGTNTIATSSMLKAGANDGATGENAVIVGARKADIIVGPIGIAIADSLLGEITPAMAVAIGQSDAKKVLIPVNKCNNIIIGVEDKSTSELIAEAIDKIKELSRS